MLGVCSLVPFPARGNHSKLPGPARPGQIRSAMGGTDDPDGREVSAHGTGLLGAGMCIPPLGVRSSLSG